MNGKTDLLQEKFQMSSLQKIAGMVDNIDTKFKQQKVFDVLFRNDRMAAFQYITLKSR